MNGVVEVEGVADAPLEEGVDKANEGKAWFRTVAPILFPKSVLGSDCAVLFLSSTALVSSRFWFPVTDLSNSRSFISVKGVPDFWLTAMKTNEILAEEVGIWAQYLLIPMVIYPLLNSWHILVQITERDEEALKYLKDIKWCRLDNPKGFKLEFFFDTNPFFKNSVLTKTYHMIDDDNEPILEKAIG